MKNLFIVSILFFSFNIIAGEKFHLPATNDTYVLKENIEILKKDQKTCLRFLTLDVFDCGIKSNKKLERKIASHSHFRFQREGYNCRIQIKDKLTDSAKTPILYKEVAKKSSFNDFFERLEM